MVSGGIVPRISLSVRPSVCVSVCLSVCKVLVYVKVLGGGGVFIKSHLVTALALSHNPEFNSLTSNIILDWSKLKAFTDDKKNVERKLKPFF